MKDLIVKLLFLLVPPKDADPAHVFVYRCAVSSCVVILILAVSAIYASAPHVASNIEWRTDAEARHEMINKRIDALEARADVQWRGVRLSQIKSNLNDQVWNACAAVDAQNQAALKAANEEIQRLSDEYYDLTRGQVFNRLPCDAVLIKEHR